MPVFLNKRQKAFLLQEGNEEKWERRWSEREEKKWEQMPRAASQACHEYPEDGGIVEPTSSTRNVYACPGSPLLVLFASFLVRLDNPRRKR